MSWIVQHLLRNSIDIKTVPDIESDEYNNLLTIESKIDDLYNHGLLSDMDILIINSVADNRPLKDLESSVDKNRITISKSFIQICDRIAYFLGGYFTDDGFLDNLKSQYRVTDSELEYIKNHMQGKFKHKLLRKRKND